MNKAKHILIAAATSILVAGCASKKEETPTTLPSVAPATQPGASLTLGGAQIKPMYKQIVAIDLATVSRLAMAQSIDIEEAKQRVLAAKGRHEASVEAVFPVIAPAFTYQHFEGANQNASGTPVITNFNNLVPALTVQWIINPGKVIYDIVAAKRRLEASQSLEKSAEIETLRTAMSQYYDLVYAQTQVEVTRQAVAQAEESARITKARVKAGKLLAADDLRAQAHLAERQQDLLIAVNEFYQRSVALSVTLHMDSAVTLVPGASEIQQTTLVRGDLALERLLGLAVEYRPDLKEARELLLAAEADKKAVIWGALGPNLQAAYTFGGLKTKVHDQSFAMHEFQKGSAGGGFNLGLSTFGQTKAAGAEVQAAALSVEKQLDEVRAQVISAQQASIANSALVPVARQQVESAEEALRLTKANLKSGTMLLLDVLQAEDATRQARLRYAGAVVHYNQSQVNFVAALGLLQSQATPATQPKSE